MATFDLTPNDLVTSLGKKGPEVLDGAVPLTAAALRGIKPKEFGPSQSPERRYLVGYLGKPFTARGEDWCVLYLDWELRTWLLIQASGVVGRDTIPKEPGNPADQDALWVKADAAVCSGNEALSLEGLFLIGHFTRVGDFDVESLAGGTQAAGTGGYGLAGQSPPRCCYKTNRRP